MPRGGLRFWTAAAYEGKEEAGVVVGLEGERGFDVEERVVWVGGEREAGKGRDEEVVDVDLDVQVLVAAKELFFGRKLVAVEEGAWIGIGRLGYSSPIPCVCVSFVGLAHPTVVFEIVGLAGRLFKLCGVLGVFGLLEVGLARGDVASEVRWLAVLVGRDL